MPARSDEAALDFSKRSIAATGAVNWVQCYASMIRAGKVAGKRSPHGVGPRLLIADGDERKLAAIG
jgi:hypothetical protein